MDRKTKIIDFETDRLGFLIWSLDVERARLENTSDPAIKVHAEMLIHQYESELEAIQADNSDSLIKFPVKVEWVELGEGLDGDYNEDDPEDVELLRFDVYEWVNGEWEPVDNASYCTNFPVSATKEQRREGLKVLMAGVYKDLVSGNSIKKICEKLSWIGIELTVESPFLDM